MSKTVINIVTNTGESSSVLDIFGEIMSKIDDLAARLNAVTERLGKVGTEVTTAVDALRATIEAKGNVPADVETALANLEAAVVTLDDLNADAVVQEPVNTDPVDSAIPDPDAV